MKVRTMSRPSRQKKTPGAEGRCEEATPGTLDGEEPLAGLFRVIPTPWSASSEGEDDGLSAA